MSAVRIPQESQGPCRACGRVGLLGDGLCVKCDDSAAVKHEVEESVRNKTIAQRVAGGVLPSELAREYHLSIRQILRITQEMRDGGAA